MTWHAVWKNLRTAPNLPTVRSRLDEILAKFPKPKSYVDFMWRNVSIWATCAFTWELDYGFQASLMQEDHEVSVRNEVITLSILFLIYISH